MNKSCLIVLAALLAGGAGWWWYTHRHAEGHGQAANENLRRLGMPAMEQAAVPPKNEAKGEIDALTSDEALTNALAESGVLVLDCYFNQCPACVQMAPLYEKAAGHFAGQARFAKINIREVAGVAQRLNVHGAPTFIIFKNGVEVARQVGSCPRDEFFSFVQKGL